MRENTAREWPGISLFRPFVLSVILFVSLSLSVYAQTYNVVDIKVEGNKLATTSLILSVAGITKGSELNATVTQDVTRRLFGLGMFQDVEILADEVTGGLAITIRVIELPKLGELKFAGNKEIKDKDLVEKLSLAGGNYLSRNLIFEKKSVILDLYGEKGYFMAQIDYDLSYSADSSTADLTYKIREGSRVKVENVVLTGNKVVPADKIIGKMRNRKRGILRTSNFDKEKYDEDKDKIIEFLHKKGFVDAFLKYDSIAIDSAANRMTIYLDIFEGPKYYFGTTSFTGNQVFSSDELGQVLKHKKGQVFDSEKFDESLYEIYFIYQEKGYLHSRIIDDRKTRDSLIDITFDIVEGLPSEVNLVKIVGNTKTRENVIRREMVIRPGQVFHRSLLLRSIRNIMQLNYFGNVTPDIADLPSGDVDLVIKVEEKPTAQISAGAGYSGRDKFVGTLSLGIPNFRGTGQELSLSIDIGSRRNSYSLSFTEPWIFSTPTLLGVDLYATNREWYTDYTEGQRGGSIRVGRRLRWPDDYYRATVSCHIVGNKFYDFSDAYRKAYSYHNTVTYDSIVVYNSGLVDTVDSSIPDTVIYGEPIPGSLLAFGEEWSTSSSLQFSVVRDSRDLPEFATTGSIMSYTFEKTGGLLGGYWNSQRHILSLSRFIPVYKKIALAGQLTLGIVSSPGSDNTILESDRFAPGGTGYSGTVRGYEDGSLTPDTSILGADTVFYRWAGTGELYKTRIDTGTVTVRGKYMLVGNLELQVPIVENQLYGLLFFDAGNSWLNRRDIKLAELYKGVGIGFRLIVPGIGTLGFDFGYALDERTGQKRGWKPHFQVGTTFR